MMQELGFPASPRGLRAHLILGVVELVGMLLVRRVLPQRERERERERE